MPEYKHGHCRRGKLSKTYMVWQGMKTRCDRKSHRYYKDYGGRGIRYCKRWEKFENFLKDMGENPDGMSLDRIDCNGDYKPSNCRWAINSIQQLNKRKKNAKTAASKYAGVCLDKRGKVKKWNSSITSNGKRKFLGLFATEKEASEAYQKEKEKIMAKLLIKNNKKQAKSLLDALEKEGE